MTPVIVTDEALRAINASEAVRNLDGSWTILLSYEVLDRLAELSFAGESLSDTILRVIARATGGMH